MGPRFDERGNLLPWVALVSRLLLQWGRASMSAETWPRRGWP